MVAGCDTRLQGVANLGMNAAMMVMVVAMAMEMEMAAARVDGDGCGEDDDEWRCCAMIATCSVAHLALALL